MKKFFLFLLSLSFLLLACTPVQPTATLRPTSESDPMDTPWQDRSIFKDGLVPAQQPILTVMKSASVYHLEFNIARDLYHVTGREEVYYTNNETVTLDRIELRLFPNILGGEMAVSNITIDDKIITPSYDLDNSLLILPLAAPLEPGQRALIRMGFAVTVPQSVEDNYGVLAYYENVLALAHAYPMICVYDDEGWNAEIPSQSGDVTYADASFYIVKVTAPKDLTLVATGRQVQSNPEAETQTVIIANGPARDFYLVASPNLEKVSKTFGDVTINSYAPAEAKPGAEFAMQVASKAIKDYSVRYAPYPYAEFDIVSTPTQALGIEYPGLIAIAERIYDVSGEYQGAPTSIYLESTVAHEVAHQWFYGLVGDDQLDDPWLDESLAQFVTLEYFTDAYGEQGAQGFRSSLVQRWQTVDNAKIPIGLPVARYSGQEYGAIVYGRGALFFEALKNQMGETKFDEFMKDYTAQLSWGIATPQFLQSLAEKHCACDLDALFQEWVYP